MRSEKLVGKSAMSSILERKQAGDLHASCATSDPNRRCRHMALASR